MSSNPLATDAVDPEGPPPDEFQVEQQAAVASQFVITVDGIAPSSQEAAGTPRASNYSQMLKSSSIVGSAQIFNVLIGMVRTKGLALLLGRAGVGEVSLLTSAIQMVTVASELGIGQSAVREVAAAHATGDKVQLARTIKVLRRICWVTGAMGWVIAAVMAYPLSNWSFGNDSHAAALAILGGTILLGQISAGQAALIQGMRRIGDLAKQTVIGAAMGTTASLALYAIWGREAIVPALLMVAACSLLNSWRFARRIPVEPVSLSFGETIRMAKRFVTLGLAFMYAALVVIGTNWAIQAFVTQRFGAGGNGIYSAAWSMSTQFAAFVLLAMAADFYPRLAGLANDHKAMNRLINEQTEIGIFLALPGLIATLACGPWVMRLFYSKEFLEAANLLPWFVLGIFGRVISWPLGYVQLALRRGKLFAATETIFALIQLSLVYLLARFLGMPGVAITFALIYSIYIPVMRIVVGYLTGFKWSSEVRKLLAESTLLVGVSFVLARTLPQSWALGVVGGISIVTGVYCLRGLAARLGPYHRVTRLAARVPWLLPRADNSSPA